MLLSWIFFFFIKIHSVISSCCCFFCHSFNLNLISFITREGNTTPLDLSVRRLSVDRSYRERSASISSSISGDLQRINMDALNDGKENLLLNSSNSASPEQIVCAPSLPGSPPPLTPSPKRSSCSPRGILTLSPSSLASSLHLNQPNAQAASTILRPLLVNELTARLAEPNSVAAVLNSSAQHLLDGQNFDLALNIATNVNNVPLPIAKTTSPISAATGVTKKPIVGASAALPLVQPQIFVKQGVSKCKECNIVFCKYENYLAHKKHYCSSRNIEDNSDGKVKPSPPTSPLAAINPTGNSSGTIHGAYQQLICAACGIKFTSLDNLKAHQTYYCTKRIEVPAVRMKFAFFILLFLRRSFSQTLYWNVIQFSRIFFPTGCKGQMCQVQEFPWYHTAVRNDEPKSLQMSGLWCGQCKFNRIS